MVVVLSKSFATGFPVMQPFSFMCRRIECLFHRFCDFFFFPLFPFVANLHIKNTATGIDDRANKERQSVVSIISIP